MSEDSADQREWRLARLEAQRDLDAWQAREAHFALRADPWFPDVIDAEVATDHEDPVDAPRGAGVEEDAK